MGMNDCPVEILENIFKYCDNKSILNLGKVNNDFYHITKKKKTQIKEKLLSALIVTTLGFLFFLYGRIIDIFIANPIFFGLYSTKLMILNTIYVIGFLCSFGLFLYLPIKK